MEHVGSFVPYVQCHQVVEQAWLLVSTVSQCQCHKHLCSAHAVHRHLVTCHASSYTCHVPSLPCRVMGITLHGCCVSVLPPSSTTHLFTCLLCPSGCAGLFTHFPCPLPPRACCMQNAGQMHGWAHLFACMLCANLATWWDRHTSLHASMSSTFIWWYGHTCLCAYCVCTAPSSPCGTEMPVLTPSASQHHHLVIWASHVSQCHHLASCKQLIVQLCHVAMQTVFYSVSAMLHRMSQHGHA